MNNITISINLPSCGNYSVEELTEEIRNYALSLVIPTYQDIDEDEEREIARRINKINAGTKLIPHEEVVKSIMATL